MPSVTADRWTENGDGRMGSLNAAALASDTYGKSYGSQFLFVLIVIIVYIMIRRWLKKRR
jgi:hypothetical protein